MRYVFGVIAIVIVVAAFLTTSCRSTARQSHRISVGGTILEITDPPGFRPITRDMAPFFESEEDGVPANNKEFFCYIAESEIPKALKGELPAAERKFRVQMDKGDIDVSTSPSEFLEFKRLAKEQRDAMIEKIAKELRPSISPTSALPPHQETDQTWGYSAFAELSGHDEAGNSISRVFVVTSMLVYVRGKILFLYVYAEEGGLEWSRTAAKQWTDSIIAANPPEARSSG